MRNIIWIFIDSLSQLFINKEDSPFLWEELNKSLWFSQCIATTPYTNGSFYSQITGRYAQHSGYNAYRIPKDRFTKKPYSEQSDIVSVFRKRGYYTVLHSSSPEAKNQLGGFIETHRVPLIPTKGDFEDAARPSIEPLFWCYHYASFLRGLKGRHDRKKIQGILHAEDRRIQAFVKSHVKPDDIVVYSSDHGFGTKKRKLGAPVEKWHGVTFMECCICVPFAIKGIELSGKISQMVRSVDIAPTLLDLIDEKLDDTDGINLLPCVRKGNIPDLETILETGPLFVTPYQHSRFGVRDNNYKYEFTAPGNLIDPMPYHRVRQYLSEHLYSSTIMEPKTDVVDDDGIIIEDPELLKMYREKVLSYLEQYGLDTQREQLLKLKGGES